MDNTKAPDTQKVRAGVREKAQLMSASEIDRTLLRLVYEIVERHDGADELVFVGVKRRGVPLAERLAKKISDLEKIAPPVATLDITNDPGRAGCPG
jgi:pyrimidine operon attenuation protein / uracil phosphoribosyltransferase